VYLHDIAKKIKAPKPQFLITGLAEFWYLPIPTAQRSGPEPAANKH